VSQIEYDQAVRPTDVGGTGTLVDTRPVEVTDEDALLKEARRRQRHRRAWIAAVLALIVMALIGFSLADRGSNPPPRPRSHPGPGPAQAFIRLAEKGATRTFAGVYQVTGAHSGEIEVDQKQDPLAFNQGSGTWSFVYRASEGISSQWIQKGSSSYDCWQAASDTTWTCSGPGSYRQANGFILATEPFIPSGLTGQLNQLQEAQGHKGWVKSLTIFKSHSPQFGVLSCMKVMALTLSSPATICIDHNGTMVSETNWPGGYFSNVSLEHHGTSIPSAAFTPLSAPRPGLMPIPQ
jgi:hypothetical protein